MNQLPKSTKTIFHSTLKEYEQVQHRILRTGMLGREVMKFLRVKDLDIVKEASQFPEFDLPQIHLSIGKCFPHWKLVKTTGHGWHRDFWAPEYLQCTTGTGEVDYFMSQGVMFFETEDGVRRVVLVETDNNGIVRLVLMCPSANQAQLRLESCKLSDSIKNDVHYLQGTAIRANGKLLTLGRPVLLDDVALSPTIRTAIEENVVGFFRQRKRFMQVGLPQSRGDHSIRRTREWKNHDWQSACLVKDRHIYSSLSK